METISSQAFNGKYYLTLDFRKPYRNSYQYYAHIECKDCGDKKTILKAQFKNYHTCQNCNKIKYRKDFEEFENESFKVLNFYKSGRNKNDRKLFYNVKCKSCGTESIMLKQSVLDSKSCYHCSGNGVIPDINTIYKRMYASYRNGAISRGLSWELTLEDIKNLSSKNCYYCGIEPLNRTYSKYNKTNREVLTNGIDRIDNNKGYLLENTTTCCSKCNRMKSNFTLDEFLIQVENIYKKLKEGSTTIP